MEDFDVRAAVTQAYEQAEAAGNQDAGGAGEDSSGGSAAAADAGGGGEGAAVQTADLVGESGAAAPSDDASGAAQRARDKAGRFAKEKAAKAAKAVEAAKVTADPIAAQSPAGTAPPGAGGDSSAPAAPATPSLKAPASWRPAARDKWASLPPEIQAEANRVDAEVRRTMQESAGSRRFEQEFRQATQPYEQIFRESGLDPIRATQNLLQTVHTLRSGDIGTVANVLASMAGTFGGRFGREQFIQALDDALTKPQAAQPHAQQQQMSPAAIAAQVRQELERDWTTKHAERELETFLADSAHEFAEDVLPDMMGIISAARQRGVEMSYKEAYGRAVYADPEIRGILQKRDAAAAAKAQAASTQQAKLAASSVKSTPSTAASAARPAKNIRDMVAAHYDHLEGT